MQPGKSATANLIGSFSSLRKSSCPGKQPHKHHSLPPPCILTVPFGREFQFQRHMTASGPQNEEKRQVKDSKSLTGSQNSLQPFPGNTSPIYRPPPHPLCFQ
ncbi:UNVERIFIED_CONTAM: hypothetical protein K2H54_071450 [Gekko kuhli]